MKRILAASVAAAVAVLQALPADAGGRSKERRPQCGRTDSCGTLSRADREGLSRAMSRNVLHSIDDRLRRQRYH